MAKYYEVCKIIAPSNGRAGYCLDATDLKTKFQGNLDYVIKHVSEEEYNNIVSQIEKLLEGIQPVSGYTMRTRG